MARDRVGSRRDAGRGGAVAVASALALVLVGCGDDAARPNAETVGTEPCVDVAHVDARQRDDLEVIGTGFGADEGHVVRVLVTHGEPAYGLGEASIQAGAFDLYLPGVLGDYTGIGVYVDRIRNDACDVDDEVLWQMTTGPASARGPFISQRDGHSVWEVTPDPRWVFEQAGACNLNGIFDLTAPLDCQ